MIQHRLQRRRQMLLPQPRRHLQQHRLAEPLERAAALRSQRMIGVAGSSPTAVGRSSGSAEHAAAATAAPTAASAATV